MKWRNTHEHPTFPAPGLAHLQGDITGDGRVNMGDVAKIYAHIKGSAPLTEDYQLLCADFTGDGRINVGDTAKVYSKIKAN